MEKKRLLVTTSTFPRWEEDTEPRFVLDLCKELKNYFNVTVLAPACPGAKERETIEGVNVVRYHYFPIKKKETLCYPGAIVPRIKEKKVRALLVPFLFFGLWRTLRHILPEYDLVHAHWLIPQGIVQSFFKKPYLVTGHGGDVTSLNRGIFKRLKIRCLKNAQAVTVVSEALRQEVLKLCPDIDISVLSMGCDTASFGPVHRVENLWGQGSHKVVLFVGRLVEKKGVIYLIDAIKGTDAHLTIVGDGPLRKELEARTTDQKEKFHFLGAKTHEELKSIYASADLFCAPSVTAQDGDKEGFGLVILEAMASGLPVIASCSGGIPDIITDGLNGYLVPEKDVSALQKKIYAVLQSESIRQRFIQNGFATVQDKSYKTIAIKYAQLLHKI